ncbi:carbon monoxide dehydrogenase accessory protein CooC [Desulfosporosinus sp.]|uniref:ATP-binding protein n=1 Tax=Desulfosporosinus sp. TaxID=157907 RepID=UPI002326B487|nr:carbon monoxide dehydrogenase accessory protein CooC [Desulfosporosinus sp.]MCO5385120.1 carbon monoxide dehydrogenase accessory protein CooC [Desulfosporosinus sp.]MDA8222203.1 carbon monoxide dehydrogenase accessory protein CooC [Desulfitobacterium hafniense]
MREKSIKIAISGKGGVGKTTLSSLLCYLYARDGQRVLAVDADPDANLGTALGFPPELLANLTPISEERKLIKERTGAEPGTIGAIYSLNPQVEDIPDTYVAEYRGIKLLRMGSITQGGTGCACPENTLLKSLLDHIVLERNEIGILDMEAGLEHFGRGTARGVDAFIVVVEPGRRSIETAHAVVKLANDLGVQNVYAVVNKVHEGQLAELEQEIDFLPILGRFPYDPVVVDADFRGKNLFDLSESFVQEAEKIKEKIDSLLR